MNASDLASYLGVAANQLYRWGYAGYLHPEYLINSDGKVCVYGSGDVLTATRMVRLTEAGLSSALAYRLVSGDRELTSVLIAEIDGATREPVLESTFHDEPAAECAVVDAMDLCVAVREIDPRDLWRELEALLAGEPRRLLAAVVALAAMVDIETPVSQLLAWTESLRDERGVA